MEEDHRRAEQQYRQYADDLFKIAEQTAEQDERARLLRMADAWLELAAKMKLLRGGT
ncbi:MAG TPA: hypothetical protein VNQ74_18245 [Burkholderiaceae bacterium]|jgi:hypothetical protein|nr:hypothetical protein [Burkholderiaceae bacterium]